MKRFTQTHEKLVYENRFIQLFDDEVTTPTGAPGHYVRLRYQGNPPGVVIVPRLNDGRYLLLYVFRYAFQGMSWEFPRGMAEGSESVEDGARRELREETALEAAAMMHLGFLRPDTAIVETEVEVFLAEIDAEAITRIVLDTDGEGIADYRLMTRENLLASTRSGEIRDGFTIGAIGLLAAAGLL